MKLQKRFRFHKKEIQLGLLYKLLLRQGKWEEAYSVWEQLENKTAEINKAILYRINELKSKDPSVSIDERKKAKEMTDYLKDSLFQFYYYSTMLKEDEDEIPLYN